MKKRRLSLILAFIICTVSVVFVVTPVSALSGTQTLYFHEHEGTGPSITLYIDGHSCETGTIKYILDTTNPKNIFEIFDYDKLTAREEVDFIVTCPLFDTLGIDPVKVHVVETGNLTVLSPIDPIPGEEYDFVFETTLTGEVAVPSDSPFSGWTWINEVTQEFSAKGTVDHQANPGVEVEWKKIKNAKGTATDPDGNTYDMVFTGEARLNHTPVLCTDAPVLWTDAEGYIYPDNVGTNFQITDTGNLSVPSNVGIGTTDPQKKLDIASETYKGLGICLRSLLLGGTSWDIDNDEGVFKIVEHATCAPEFLDNPRIVVVGNCIGSPYGGNVGIGTADPAFTLDVHGNGRFYCCEDSNSSIQLEPSLYPDCNGVAITLNEYRNRNKLWISAYDRKFGNLIYTEDPQNGIGQGFGIAGGSRMASFPRFVVNSDETFLGYSVYSGNDMNGAPSTGGDGDGNLYIRGNVGIGTKNPIAKLHVLDGHIRVEDNGFADTIRAFKQSAVGRAGEFVIMNASNPSSVLETNTLGTGPLLDLKKSGWTKVIVTNDGNVGIGTTSPARKLHVNDVMRLEPRSTAPSSASEGDIYMNGTIHKLMVYDGTTWQACW